MWSGLSVYRAHLTPNVRLTADRTYPGSVIVDAAHLMGYQGPQLKLEPMVRHNLI